MSFDVRHSSYLLTASVQKLFCSGYVNHLSPQEALRAIMTLNNLSQAQMGKIIGSESAISMFLKGERSLSKTHIKALVTRFRADPGLFL